MYQNISSFSLEELKTGYRYDEAQKCYLCLHCGASFAEGEVFPLQGRYLLAEAAIAEHVREHADPLGVLLDQERKVTGLTDNQRALCRLLAQGLSDNEVAAQTGVAATTVRHQRFILREHAKVARVQLAIFELLEQAMQEKRHPDPKEEVICS